MMRLVNWAPSRIWNSEMINASAGIIWMRITRTRNDARPRNRNRASATAARKATTSANPTTISVTSALFFIAVQKYSRSKTRR